MRELDFCSYDLKQLSSPSVISSTNTHPAGNESKEEKKVIFKIVFTDNRLVVIFGALKLGMLTLGLQFSLMQCLL